MYIYKLFPNKYTIPKRHLEIKFIQKVYSLANSKCFTIKHQRIHPSGMRAKPCATWLFVGKHLELPEPHNL